MTLQEHNTAVRLQQRMDTYHQNIFARALPREDTRLIDWEALSKFATCAMENPNLGDALDFLDTVIRPNPLLNKLSGTSQAALS